MCIRQTFLGMLRSGKTTYSSVSYFWMDFLFQSEPCKMLCIKATGGEGSGRGVKMISSYSHFAF